MAVIACVGGGLVGTAWAALFANAGHTVRIYDQDRNRLETAGLTAIKNALDALSELSANGAAGGGLERVTVAPTLAEAVAGAWYVQESVREDLAIKKVVAKEIADAVSADCVIASSTSALPGSTFLSDVPNPERALVAHPVNPPSHVPLVELCGTGLTSPETMDTTHSFLTEIGMMPVVLKREIDGFLLNRLQYTMVAEAMHLVGEGYCEPEDIDRVVSEGLALRWAFIGPFMTAHLNASAGFQGFVDQLGPMMRKMGEAARTDYPWTAEDAARIHERLVAVQPVETIPDAQEQRNANILRLRAIKQPTH
ncbi:MAG: 3-hydroxyacyl-CoA dehydrogenase NAD-binding domain-containing protein [Pseudomonadota bacterium]